MFLFGNAKGAIDYVAKLICIHIEPNLKASRLLGSDNEFVTLGLRSLLADLFDPELPA